MNECEWFDNTLYEDQVHSEDLELIAFTKSVTEQFGPNQAMSSERDWLDEAALMDSPPLSTGRNWHSVTVAASARLASRIDAEQHPHNSLAA